VQSTCGGGSAAADADESCANKMMFVAVLLGRGCSDPTVFENVG
jgi:hypothetical protein